MATKQLPKELLKVLRQFQIAGDLSVPKEIKDIREYEPRQGVTMYRFVFLREQYYVITDPHADDDLEILKDYIHAQQPDIHGFFVKNPYEDSFTTYGIRHKFKDTYLFQVKLNQRRLDQELAERYPEFSRSTLQKYIKAGYVHINGKAAETTKQPVTPVDDIAVAIPEPTNFSNSELPIIYIDDDVVVFFKPSGVLTHSKGVMSDEFTVAEAARRYTTHGLSTNRPGIVHRLDRDTSGIIICARHDEAAASLKKQFADRTVKKQYLAIVDGIPKQAEARIELPLGRNPSQPSTFRVDPSGKSATTEYKLLAHNDTQSLLLLKPHTGRTHQLRVHMQYINTPIAGDRVYNASSKATRLMLHAYSLELTLPSAGRKQFVAKAPTEFSEVFKEASNV